MEEKSLKVLDTNKTFFSKITTTISKLFIPTKVSINGMLISIKRNNLLKVYENYKQADETGNVEKRNSIENKYEDVFALYLEAIDKFIMDSVYKKVKNNSATTFEKEALSKYYTIVNLKDKQYIEYKYKKQEYLLKIDYETVNSQKKENIAERYSEFYQTKMESLCKGLLKNYSVQIADTTRKTAEEMNKIYTKIFDTLESYIEDILPIKLQIEEGEEYTNLEQEHDNYERACIGKLDERDRIRKKIILLRISRILFTHSLPLSAAEQCYNKIIEETRDLILKETNKIKKDKTFDLLFEILEDYNSRLLATKVYWDKPEEREEYKAFFEKYKKVQNASKQKTRNVLLLRYDLKQLYKQERRRKRIIKAYKEKLISIGGMRILKDNCKTVEAEVKYIKKYIKKVTRVES